MVAIRIRGIYPAISKQNIPINFVINFHRPDECTPDNFGGGGILLDGMTGALDTLRPLGRS